MGLRHDPPVIARISPMKAGATAYWEYDTELVCTGEIIMSTSRSPQAIVNGFLASLSHRANLLDPNHKYAGIGVAWGETPAGPGIAVLELFAK